MFNFSSKTLVNREYKVSDFLKQIKASKEVKEDAKKIDKIIFQNVINANSINVEEDSKYQNIYVIKLVLKTRILYVNLNLIYARHLHTKKLEIQ